MTRLDGDLGQIEKQVLAWARAPLSRTAPLEDLEGRIQSHKVGERGQEVAPPGGGGLETKRGKRGSSHRDRQRERTVQRPHRLLPLPAPPLSGSVTLVGSRNLSRPWLPHP